MRQRRILICGSCSGDYMKLINDIENFIPFNEQEERDKAVILQKLRTEPDIFSRDNLIIHMSASAWVVSPDRKQVLMAYHNIYDSWSWLGGHADGERDLLKTAMKEVREESGLQNITPVSEDIYSLEILTVDGHEKKGKYVNSHLHLNVTYLIEADPSEPVREKPDENSGVAWFEREEAVRMSSEPWFRERIYRKLNDKLDR